MLVCRDVTTYTGWSLLLSLGELHYCFIGSRNNNYYIEKAHFRLLIKATLIVFRVFKLDHYIGSHDYVYISESVVSPPCWSLIRPNNALIPQ